MNKKLRNFVFILLSFFLIIAGGFSYFFIYNEAPIIKGEVFRQVNYKANLNLDIYMPTQEVYQNHPVVIFYHGGAWIGGAKEAININRFNGTINQLRENGYAIVSANYTLASREQSPFPACIIDAFDAIKWVETHADKYQFDLENVGVFGESAGAHIALMVAFSNVNDFSPSSKSEIKLDYVVDVYGPTHLESLYETTLVDSITSLIEKAPERLQACINIPEQLFGFNPKADSLKTKAFTTRYSPISYLHPQIPPLLIIHGNQDRIVPLQQSSVLITKLDERHLNYEYHEIKNMDHAFIGASIEQHEEVENWIASFIRQQHNP
ncbi:MULTISPECIES: alpha/beta hydrolase [unclassified Lentimicrobium]|uniref:alpha/beta hydrolase n=1 Tax=unclassified Lentimicrobium TaxID=2677434 RepID=UPI00155452D7|nr:MULTISPECIES: alpha/beta hydrolase [unclassified Lentimicrobium]NPD44092.1 alpha/beta hydrolase [Lentimicrobium sp. S6]NPD86239.1 alpha/beta hydrolase [Lentimicrobium sp. L6]